jgi:hypothetical protein
MNGVHGLVDRLAAAKTQPPIQPDRSIVLGRYFKNRSAQAGPPETVKSLSQQGLA